MNLAYRIFEVTFRLLERLRDRSIYAGYRSRYEVSRSFIFNGSFIKLYGPGRIILESGSYIGSLSTLQSSAGCTIRVGVGCHISHNVRIYTESAVPDCDFSIKPVLSKKHDVVIGDYVWIGANVFISPGVTLGDNCVIGANSVVTKSVPANCIYGGVPARLLRVKSLEAV